MNINDNILVATDFSANAERALRFAAELSRKTSAALILVHVYNMMPYAIPDGMPAYPLIDVDRLQAEYNKALEAARSSALQAGAAQVRTVLLQGVPYQELVRFAEEHKSSLIVMGTHGRSGFAHLLLGSVAEKVVRKASCPVIAVPLRESGTKAA